MGIPYRARVSERRFLNLPGFRGGAYVLAYVEDTRARGPRRDPYCDDDCPKCPHNFEPKLELEIADCTERINLEFDVDSKEARMNSLYKLDTLIDALRIFRKGIEEEFEQYDRRERELKEQKGE